MCHTGGRHSSGVRPARTRAQYWLGPRGGPGLATLGLGLTPSVALDAMDAMDAGEAQGEAGAGPSRQGTEKGNNYSTWVRLR
jgi:hypothetical protein